MPIEIDSNGGVVTIKPVGRLDAANAPDFDANAAQAIGGGNGKVMVDLSGLEYISSAGLRCMLLLAKKMKAGGGALVLAGLTGMVANVFEVSGFTPMFMICADAAEGLNRLGG